eukprot:COSAG01_NODE_63367_length_280_cov_0.845304_1_plen_82_part_10
MLAPEHLATIRAMLKPIPLTKFTKMYEQLTGAGGGSIPEGVAEKPDGASAPEPEPSAREVHSAGSTPTSVDVAGAADWTLSP